MDMALASRFLFANTANAINCWSSFLFTLSIVRISSISIFFPAYPHPTSFLFPEGLQRTKNDKENDVVERGVPVKLFV
jgi:hypothetical protein